MIYILGLNVLSLFDGISCGHMATNDASIPINKYFSSEISQSAIKVTQFNFPETIQLGDVRMVNSKNLPKIDLLLGGSPCQGFSINGNRLNFDDERSKLLFEYIRIRDELKPKYWLLENVATMSPKIKEKIDEYVGVTGVFMNSNVFSPQNRKRYYWTNIPFTPLNEPSNLLIRDILEFDSINHIYFPKEYLAKQLINPSCTDGVITLNPKKIDGSQTYQHDRIYDCNGKMVALTAMLGNRFRIQDEKGKYRKLTIREQARLQTIPDYISFQSITDLQASKCIGNCWTVKIISSIIKNIQ